MATVSQVFDVGSARVFSSGIPELIQINGTGTVAWPVFAYAFDSAAVEQIFFYTNLRNYGASNPTLNLTINWYSRSGSTTNAVVWGWNLGAVTPGDAISMEAKSLATAQTTTTTVNSTAKGLTTTLIANTANKDSAAANDDVIIRVYRDAAAGGDTLVGDAIIMSVTLDYSDT